MRRMALTLPISIRWSLMRRISMTVITVVAVLRLVKAGEIALVEVVFVMVDKPRIVGGAPPMILTALGLITDVLLVMKVAKAKVKGVSRVASKSPIGSVASTTSMANVSLNITPAEVVVVKFTPVEVNALSPALEGNSVLERLMVAVSLVFNDVHPFNGM
jgi:hypothetical protein